MVRARGEPVLTSGPSPPERLVERVRGRAAGLGRRAGARAAGAGAGAGRGRHVGPVGGAGGGVRGDRSGPSDGGVRGQPDAAARLRPHRRPLGRASAAGGCGRSVCSGWWPSSRCAGPSRACCGPPRWAWSRWPPSAPVRGGPGCATWPWPWSRCCCSTRTSAGRSGSPCRCWPAPGIIGWARSWSALLARWLPRVLADAVAVPLAAHLATLPVVAAISGQVSVSGLFANAVAGPFVGPATVLGFAAAGLSLVTRRRAAAVSGSARRGAPRRSSGWRTTGRSCRGRPGPGRPPRRRWPGSAVGALIAGLAMGWVLTRPWLALALAVVMVVGPARTARTAGLAAARLATGGLRRRSGRRSGRPGGRRRGGGGRRRDRTRCRCGAVSTSSACGRCRCWC